LLEALAEVPEFKHFLLKSMTSYPVYAEMLKERANSAKNIGQYYHRLKDAELIGFVLRHTDPLSQHLLAESKECFRMLQSRLQFALKFNYLLSTTSFKEISSYVETQNALRWQPFSIVQDNVSSSST
jgi:hypothetical protein